MLWAASSHRGLAPQDRLELQPVVGRVSLGGAADVGGDHRRLAAQLAEVRRPPRQSARLVRGAAAGGNPTRHVAAEDHGQRTRGGGPAAGRRPRTPARPINSSVNSQQLPVIVYHIKA